MNARSYKPCIIIPNYNHGAMICTTLERLAPLDLPAIVVDDGSDAATKAVLATLTETYPWVTVHTRARNGGKGAAVMDGLQLACDQGYSHAVQVDADGQHTLEDVPILLRASQERPEAMVTGAPSFDANAPAGRKIGRHITNFWVWVETLSRDIDDAMCGFRVYPLDKAVALIHKVELGTRMDFDIEILVRLSWMGVPVVNVPTFVDYPEDGASHFHMVADNVKISWMHTRLFFGMLLRLPLLVSHRLLRAPRKEGSHWAETSERGAVLGMRILAFLLRNGGLFLVRLALYPIILYFFLTGKAARAASQDFLQRAYDFNPAQSPFPQRPGLWASYLHFLEFGRANVDKIRAWLGQIPRSQVQFDERTDMLALVEKKQGAVLVGAHMGNMELCRALADGVHEVHINVLVHTRHAGKFNEILRSVSDRVNVELIQVTEIGADTAILLQQKIDRGEFVVIVGDRTPVSRHPRTTQAQFLGAPATFPQGPFILAGLLRCPVFLLFSYREGQHYRLTLEPFADSLHFPRRERPERLQAAIQQYATRLEYHACRVPLQWFNFFDFWETPNTQ